MSQLADGQDQYPSDPMDRLYGELCWVVSCATHEEAVKWLKEHGEEVSRNGPWVATQQFLESVYGGPDCLDRDPLTPRPDLGLGPGALQGTEVFDYCCLCDTFQADDIRRILVSRGYKIFERQTGSSGVHEITKGTAQLAIA